MLDVNMLVVKHVNSSLDGVFVYIRAEVWGSLPTFSVFFLMHFIFTNWEKCV